MMAIKYSIIEVRAFTLGSVMKEYDSEPMGYVTLVEWARALNVSVEHIVRYSGLSKYSINDACDLSNSTVSNRINRIQAVLSRAQNWFDNERQSWAWFIGQPITSFGNLTPSEIVKNYDEQGIDSLLEYIEHKELGAFE